MADLVLSRGFINGEWVDAIDAKRLILLTHPLVSELLLCLIWVRKNQKLLF